MNNFVTNEFVSALKDYFYLIERGYPRKELNRIVGNRYNLSKTQRCAMLRGIASKEQIKKRKHKLVKSISGKNVYLDGFNVLFTITNYLLGRIVFIANDGFLRDTGEVTGKNISSSLFYKAIDNLLDVSEELKIKSLHILFDKPVSHSGDLTKLINNKLQDMNIKGEARTVKSPDNELKKIKEGIVVTSDSAILDEANTYIHDLAHFVIEKEYKAAFIYIEELLTS